MVNVPVFDIWAYFQRQHERLLEHEQLVAQNDATGDTVYVSREGERIIIMTYDAFENPISEHEADNYVDAIDIYATALAEIGISDDGESQIDDSTIKTRETELDIAAEALVYEIAGDDLDTVPDIDLDEVCKAVKEVCCQMLANQFKIPVYRPMKLKREDGSMFISEYPYSELTT